MDNWSDSPSVAARTSESRAGVGASLTFIRPQAEKPKFYSAALTGAAPKLFFEVEPRTVRIADMRPDASRLSLDREGFVLLRRPTHVDDLYDDTQVARAYYPEVRAIVRNVLGASRIEIFDVTRRSDATAGARNPDGLRGPASRVHVDYTVHSGPQRLGDVLGTAEAARMAANKVRVVQVNVWRPIHGPVERSPLALADASSIRMQDLVATDQVFPGRVGEIYHLRYAPGQRWYYAPRMTRDEVILIKSWDSCEDGRARFTPHSSFTLPDTPRDAPARESIEVRTFAVFE